MRHYAATFLTTISLTPTIFLILLILFWVNYSKKLNKLKKNSSRTIPGPFSLPVLGTRWVFSKLGGYKMEKVHEFYEDMFRKYGSIAKEEALWNIPIINVVKKEDIEKVLKCSGKYPMRPPTEVIAYYRKSRPDRYSSMGIINEQGETWHHLRNNLTSTLTSPHTISEYLSECKEMAQDFCELIKFSKDSSGNIFSVETLTKRLGLESMCALVLARRMGFLVPEVTNKISTKMAQAVQKHFIACRDTYYGLPFWKLFRTEAYKLLEESEEDIYNIALKLVETADDSTKNSAVFQSILKADLDTREKTAAIVDFVASGIHTLGNTLIFVLQLIGSDKHLQERINSLENTERFNLIRACINESFRLYPTAHCLARITAKNLVLSGFDVPAGSVVVCHTRVACLDEENFEKPLSFQPDRWIHEEKRQKTLQNSNFLVLPFGYGKRTCPGKRFIEQSLPVILDEILRRFIIESDPNFNMECQFLMAPSGSVRMKFVERL
nr:ecdysone 20-monooxygenase isoform X2 [Onthophagus taurus]